MGSSKDLLYVQPSEQAQLLDPQVATLVELLQQAMEPAVEDKERMRLSDEVYAVLGGLLPSQSEPQMEDGQLQIWAQIQNLHKTVDDAAALLEQYQREIPEMQTRVDENSAMATKVAELATAMDMLTTKVNQSTDKSKVGLVQVDDLVSKRPCLDNHSDRDMETAVWHFGSGRHHSPPVASGGLRCGRKVVGSLVDQGQKSGD